MINLYDRRPKRLFTFGCSFTQYLWGTWANILGLELNCEFYNLGRAGAGNFYISNMITQADEIYKFNQDDLVIVSWTNITREDRWKNNQWITPGNIYTQDTYDQKFVKKWADDTHYALRDFSLIKLTERFLQKCTQYHFLSMCNINETMNQWIHEEIQDTNLKKVLELYNPTVKKILPSFYKVLWKNDINYKFDLDKKITHKNFGDGHPTLLEHLNFLQKTFNYDFSKKTCQIVENYHNNWIKYINDNKLSSFYSLPNSDLINFKDNFEIKKSDSISELILY